MAIVAVRDPGLRASVLQALSDEGLDVLELAPAPLVDYLRACALAYGGARIDLAICDAELDDGGAARRALEGLAGDVPVILLARRGAARARRRGGPVLARRGRTRKA